MSEQEKHAFELGEKFATESFDYIKRQYAREPETEFEYAAFCMGAIRHLAHTGCAVIYKFRGQEAAKIWLAGVLKGLSDEVLINVAMRAADWKGEEP